MHPTPILALPREIRDQILSDLLFPGEKEPTTFTQNGLGLARTAPRQIFPYECSPSRKPCFLVSILRTCRQLQDEGEEVLYGTSSFNLMYPDWADPLKQSYEFFERLPKRLRRRVQRVERKCYSRPYCETISLVDWKLFMMFLARQCPRLRSLVLWGPGDRREGPQWVGTCRKEEEWVQAILQIKTLRYFNIAAIAGSVINEYPEFVDDFLPWLKRQMIRHQSDPTATTSTHDELYPQPASRSSHEMNTPFRFLDLPYPVRNTIYTTLLLPPTHRLCPTLKLWYNTQTSTLLPLLLTSHRLHTEVSTHLSTTAVITSPIPKHDTQLQRLLSGYLYTPGPLARITRLRIMLGPSSHCPLLVRVVRNMPLTHLELVLSAAQVAVLNDSWPLDATGRPIPGHSPDARLAEWPRISSRGGWESGGLERAVLRAVASVRVVRVEWEEVGEGRAWLERKGQRERLRGEVRIWLVQGMRRVWLGEVEVEGLGLEWLVGNVESGDRVRRGEGGSRLE